MTLRDKSSSAPSRMPCAHTFHALWYGLGPYGPQDVHVHPCSKDGHGPNDEGPEAGCSEVLLGYDRAHCTGRIEDHERANLEDEASVDRAARRLRPRKSDGPAEIGHITQGPRRAVVRACCDEDSIWVEVRRHNGKPWPMTPEKARTLAGLLNIAATTAEAYRR